VNNAVSLVNPILINIVTAALIFLLGIVVGKIIEKLLLKFFDLIELNKLINKMVKLKFSLSKTVSRIIAYFVYIIALVMALNRLAITTTIITTAVIVIIIVMLLFMIFGINNFFANVFAGLVVRFRKNINVGDYVKISDKNKNIEGHIISLNMLNMRLETGKEEVVFIPNMAVFKSEIIKIKNNHHR
jgi:small-conductance mechanosensitive channel